MRLVIKPTHREELTLLYSENHRYFHTMEHITILFNLASAHGIKLSIPQQLSIWYHDAIYEPTRKDNEERSIELFLQHHSGTLLPQYVSRVSNIILDTKTHIATNSESNDVLDLDLAGLGFDTDSYNYHTQQVRKEYSHLSDTIWNANRKLFLQSLINREYIFHTHWGRDFYEIKARKNIQKELLSL